MCGMYAIAGILGALHERHRSGRGQYVDLSLLDTQVAWLANQNLNYLVIGQGTAPARHGAPEHRAVSGLRNGRRLRDDRGRQRCAVRALLRRDGTRCAGRRSALLEQCTTRGDTGIELMPAVAAALLRRDRTAMMAARSCETRMCPAGRSTISPGVRRSRRCVTAAAHRPAASRGGRRHQACGSPILYSRTPRLRRAPPLARCHLTRTPCSRERARLDAGASRDLRRRGVIG